MYYNTFPMEMTSPALVSVTEVVWEGSGADNKNSEKNNTAGNHGNRYFEIQHNGLQSFLCSGTCGSSVYI